MLLPCKRNQLINLLHQNFNSLSFFLFIYHLQPQGHTITTPSAVQILISQILCVMSLFLFSHDGAGVSVSISRNHMVIIVRHPPAVIGRPVLRWLWFDLRILWFVFIFLLTGGTNAHQLCISDLLSQQTSQQNRVHPISSHLYLALVVSFQRRRFHSCNKQLYI